MSTPRPKWTPEILLTPEGMHVYSDQIAGVFDRHRREFRRIRLEVFGELLADPITGDNGMQARSRALWVTRPLYVMERSAQRIITAAGRLEHRYTRHRVELPQTRRAKELQIAQRAELVGRVSAEAKEAARAAFDTDTGEAGAAPADTEPAPFDLFRNAR